MHKRSSSFAVCSLFAVAVLVPGSVGAWHGENGRFVEKRAEERIERHEAAVLRLVSEHERFKQELLDRIKRHEERMRERTSTLQEDLCRDLERIERRFGVDLTLPGYCGNDNNDDNGGGGEPPAPPTPPAPTLTLTASPGTVTVGDASVLTWTTTNATTCTASGAWSGAKATSSSESVTPVLGSNTYSLTCSGAGGSVTKDAVVTAEAAPVPQVPGVTLSANPTSVYAGSSTVLTWSSVNSASCIARGGTGFEGGVSLSGSQAVLVSATTTYSLTCGNGTASDTKSVEVVVVPTPIPSHGRVVLSEVLARPGEGQGSTSTSQNEWVELYNGSSDSIDLTNWTIRDDTTATRTIATTTLTIPAGGFVVITYSTTTPGYWGNAPAGTIWVALRTAIGSGLNDGGDALYLYDQAGVLVDAMSYGSNSKVFPTSATPDPTPGQSAARIPVTQDTDAGSDWTVLSTPTPGE